MSAANKPGVETVLDSVEMVRKRVNEYDYPKHYSQKRIRDYIKPEQPDSASTET